MTERVSETIEMDQERVLTYGLCESLALVDVETYPAFVGAKADRLDLMAHLSNQMQALTVLSWKAPETARRFRLLVTENDWLAERIARSSPAQIAAGNLRTYGQVCLTTHEHLFDCARHRTHGLLRAAARLKLARPHMFHVPPGVYSISLHYDAPFHPHYGDEPPAENAPEIDYTVVLRHYAFPPPRVAPVRLSAGFVPWAEESLSNQLWAGRNSHKSPA